MAMKRLFFTVLAATLLAGCMTVGTKVDPAAVQQFKPGVTTLSDATAKLGQPNQTTQMPDGSTLLVYAYSHSQASGSSFIPIVGAFVGHADANTQMTYLSFDKSGKFIKTWNTSGQTTAGMFTHQ
jgi:outer membrane protein assembly factor BamE (lipoprotein component of BamABCDE complex)